MLAGRTTYLGLLLISMSTLMYEVLLTRIFSVTTWYHFAFLAVSLALLGMTIGAIIVYLSPNRFTREKTNFYLALSCLAYGATAIAAALIHVYSPFLFVGADESIIVPASLFIACPFLLIAFALSGIAVSLALTRFPRQIGSLYAADLIGAAMGCLILTLSMRFIDGITEIFLVAAVSSLAALCFSSGSDLKKLRATSLLCVLAASIFVGVSTYLADKQIHIFKIAYTKGFRESGIYYERWNSFSRIRVWGDPNAEVKPEGYGLSTEVPADVKMKELWLDIDGGAATPLLFYDGHGSAVAHLKYELANIVHSLRPDGKILIIGMGGGKDVLSALTMGHDKITAVEINDNIISCVNKVYGDFTGHLDKNERVHIVNDEARSYITRNHEKYDIIQASMIDTWAASSSGAYALSENALYTVESWETLLRHLNPDGIVTMCRWYHKDAPAEFYRLTAVARAALEKLGVADPRKHIVVVTNANIAKDVREGVGVILVSLEPFSEADLKTVGDVCGKLQFDVTLSPTKDHDQVLAKLATEKPGPELADSLPYDLTPSTDERPFFFQTIKLSKLFDPRSYMQGRNSQNALAPLCLVITFVSVAFFTVYCFRIPLLKTTDKSVLKGSPPIFFYFFCIGLGFMFIEISQIQRLSLFLGHPIYGLSVALSSLLVSTGVGSLFASRLIHRKPAGAQPLAGTGIASGAESNRESGGDPDVRVIAILMLSLLIFYGLSSPIVLATFREATAVPRILATIVMLLPAGFALGLAFPVGMKFASDHFEYLTPWLWGINGAASVLGSVLALGCAIWLGLTATYWCSVVIYSLALIAYWKASRANL